MLYFYKSSEPITNHSIFTILDDSSKKILIALQYENKLKYQHNSIIFQSDV